MTRTGADLFVDALEQYDVTRLFGNPGTTELPLMRALPDSGLAYRLGLHEDIALGMAAGYACTRRYHSHHDESVNPLGVVNLHVAPGVAHALGNLQNAEVNGVPLLVTAGNHARSFRHEEPILSGDMVKMTEDYTKWSAEVEHIAALPTMVRRAVRTALTPPQGPVFLALPMDVMNAETEANPERLERIASAGRGDHEAVGDAADLLARAEDPVLVLGDQVAQSGVDAIDAAVELAEASGAAVYSEMLTAEINLPPRTRPVDRLHAPRRGGLAGGLAGRYARLHWVLLERDVHPPRGQPHSGRPRHGRDRTGCVGGRQERPGRPISDR
jgi:benzoylformate decarboxylase